MLRYLMEFRLDAAPFGPRAPELLRAALACLERAPIAGLCAAALLTEEGVIHAARTEVLLREPVRHALSMAINLMLRTPERRVLMAALARREPDGTARVLLPCGSCRMVLHAYGGGDIRIVQVCDFQPILTIIALEELLPFADGGNGRVIGLDALPEPTE
jgi:cytidine deaminase